MSVGAQWWALLEDADRLVDGQLLNGTNKWVNTICLQLGVLRCPVRAQLQRFYKLLHVS